RGYLDLGSTQKRRTPQEAGSTRSKQPSTPRCTTAPSALASSSQGGFMLNHQLMESYHHIQESRHQSRRRTCQRRCSRIRNSLFCADGKNILSLWIPAILVYPVVYAWKTAQLFQI